ncbi:hypothetical protein EST38_g14271 [Candolleomyces aberdarensis]|uniref:Uncharacterized protein n=1 Tax=Candolleomyces aberdarensis TaxID=2316362 RepID=A0A4Q2D037_9AGAR|nr:hypothetical protein EST38_g14271 [Candolleomyces aberdarensis]
MSQQPSPHELHAPWDEGIHEAQLVAQVAWQIFKAELAFASGEKSSVDAIEVPNDVEHILADILQACRACVSACQNLVCLPFTVEDLMALSEPADVYAHLPPDDWPFVVTDSNGNIVGFNIPGALSQKLQGLAEDAQRWIFKHRPSIFVEGLEQVYHDNLDAIFMPEPCQFGRGIPKISPCWLNEASGDSTAASSGSTERASYIAFPLDSLPSAIRARSNYKNLK